MRETFETNSREELIDLSIQIAECLDKDRIMSGKPVIVALYGNKSAGKSLITEAMMKSLLDGYDANEMKQSSAPQNLFIESSPSSAQRKYCTLPGSVQGERVMMTFDRMTRLTNGLYAWEDCDALKEATSRVREVFRQEGGSQGVIFVSTFDLGDLKPDIAIGCYCEGSNWERRIEFFADEGCLVSPFLKSELMLDRLFLLLVLRRGYKFKQALPQRFEFAWLGSYQA